MALLNGLYIFVTDEERSYGVDVTEHTVETGITISDHVKRKAITLTISGEIVGKNSASIQSQLMQMHHKGVVCSYTGRSTLSNCLITEFATSHPNSVWGGCEFTMTLKEIRTASTSYKAATKSTKTAKKTSTQQVAKKSNETYVYHTVKKGDTIWALVASSNAPYRNLSRPKLNGKSYNACDWVMAQNQSAFSRKGDFRTLQIGKKIVVGVRSGGGSNNVRATAKK